MNKQIKKPARKPGSQVAPNERPFVRVGGQTATTHHRQPLSEITEGKLYRVRDKMDADGSAYIWGENLSFEDANKLKEKVVGSRKSRTARVEEMPPDEIALEPITDDAGELVDLARPAFIRELGENMVKSDTSIDYTQIQDAQLLRVLKDDASKWAAAFTQHAKKHLGITAESTFWTDFEGFAQAWFANAIESRPRPQLDPQLTEVQKRIKAVAGPTAQAAQVRADQAKATKAKVATVMAAPPTPPPSPLSDDLVDLPEGDAALPDDDVETLAAGDVSDLTSDIGGAPSDADKQHAAKTSLEQLAADTAAAISEYDAAVESSKEGPWPEWDSLGDFEKAAWRYYATQGGDPPKLTHTMRKVGHAMGPAQDQPQ